MDAIFTRLQDLRLDTRHPLNLGLATAGTLAALSAGWIYWDYRAWVSFGTGGTPPTPSGYWRMTKIRWATYRSGADMRDASVLNNEKPAYLKKPLPTRAGQRPRIVGRTMPQRHVPENIPQDVRERAHALAKKFCDAHPDILVFDKSLTEGGSTDAIFARPGLPGRDARAVNRIVKDEIAHVHHSDDSLHVWLSPADAKDVVEKGWGELFPLTRMGLTPPGLVMVYSPRTMEEVDVIEVIIKASIAFLTGVQV